MGFKYDKSTDALGNTPEDKVPQPTVRIAARRGLTKRRRNSFVSIVVVGLIVIASLMLFGHRSTIVGNNTPIGKPIGTPVGMPILSHPETGGLETTLSITPGPYFLSELLAVDITLTNNSRQEILLEGSPGINVCTGAFSVTITGGQEPHYDVPEEKVFMSCPPVLRKLEVKKSVTAHGYVPLTKSGAVTLRTEVRVGTVTHDQNGLTSIHNSQALDGQWPTLAITVSPQIPSDRQFSLQTRGNDVIVNAPEKVRPHLVYFYTVSCMHGSGTNGGWEPLHATTLQEPYCDDAFKHWVYAVSAPGYAVTAASMGF